MEELLQFARFENCNQLSEQQALDLLETVDVNYCVPDDPHHTGRTKDLTGYTYLHIAARKSYYDCVKELLNRGVDILKQTPADNERTPLLYGVSFFSPKRNDFGEMMGILKHKVADLLLSAQIKTGNAFNPNNVDGMSHLHVACIFNHTEAIKFFLDAGVSIDQAFNSDHYYLPGYTALHCAIRYSSVDSVKILVNCGADIHLKDSKGRSSLHLLIERLINLTDFINMGKRACCLTVKEEIKRVESMVCCILEKKTSEGVNISDDKGLTALHLACTLSDTSVVEDYLQQSLDINASISDDSKFWPGYTPLHFAAHFNIGTVKLLLQKGSIITKNADGKTALDLCMERYSSQIIHSILSCRPEFKTIVLSDGSTKLLDIVLLMKNYDKFDQFLKKSRDVNMSVPLDSPIWPGNTLLLLSILMNEKTINADDFYKYCTFEENKNAAKKSFNCTEIEELAYQKRIIVCLLRGCNVSLKNADGLTPIHLAFKLKKAGMVDKLLNSCKSNATDLSNLTHFHIACIVGKKALVERFLSQGVDVNSSVNSNFEWIKKPLKYDRKKDLTLFQANSTPLHMAVRFEHTEIVKLLLEKGANVYAQDALGFTPIHLSLKFKTESKLIAQLLLSKTSNLKELVSNEGLTHLHVAAYANDATAVDKLVEAGSDVDAVFDYEEQKQDYYQKEWWFIAENTPLHIAVYNESCDATRALILRGADIMKEDNYMNTPFTQALGSHTNSDYTKCLVKKAKRQYKQLLGPIHESGLTMLHVACGCFDLMWAKQLLERGADVNARIRDEDDYENDTWRGMTPLFVLIYCAYMSDKLPKNCITLVKLLLKYGADVTIGECITRTSLHAIDHEVDKDSDKMPIFSTVLDLLLKNQKSYTVNPTCPDGVSHAHIACKNNNIDIFKKFLDNGIDIDHHVDYCAYGPESGFTSLHFAFQYGHADLARLLIERGADVNAKAFNGNTPLHVAVKNNFKDLDVLELLYKNGADFDWENLDSWTPFQCLIMMEYLSFKQFDFFLKCECEFDYMFYESHEGFIGLAIKNALPKDRKLIFQKLIKIENVKSGIADGFNAIHSVVSVNQNGHVTHEFYVYAIKLLMQMGCDLDKRDGEGRTPIYDAIYFYNLEALKALLQLGANINVVDNRNESPLRTTVTSDDSSIEMKRKVTVYLELVMHAWKMKFLGLELKSCIEEDISSSLIGNMSPANNLSMLQCRFELEKLENTKICDSLSVKSFLRKGISTYSSMTSSDRKDVDDFFKRNVTDIFPEFGGILRMQYRKAISKLEHSETTKKK